MPSSALKFAKVRNKGARVIFYKMNRYFLLCAILAMVSGCCRERHTDVGFANDEVLSQQLVESGFLHSPLPLDYSRSNEQYGLEKVLLKDDLVQSGPFEISYVPFPGKRAVGSPDDPDYANYGSSTVAIDLNGYKLEEYNRIYYKIYPDCPGLKVCNLDLDIPGSASHLINLRNGQWNECYLELGSIDTKDVSSISFRATLRGTDLTATDTVRYKIEDIRLQKVENPKKFAGWEPSEGVIIYSTTGYDLHAGKTAFAAASTVADGDVFKVKDDKGKVILKGKAKKETTTIGEYSVMDFSELTKPGTYTLETENASTKPFIVSDDVWTDVEWKVLNYIFCQRCGYDVPGVHSECHRDLMSCHDGKRISFSGGWHDAGDLSQQCLQSGDIVFDCLEAYNSTKEKNPVLAARLLEEARWGIDFILKNRYGDGYRASSVGLVIWQDNVLESLDDINSVRVQNVAFDNFLYSAYEAFASMNLPDDPALSTYLRKVAIEDFDLAMEKFRKDGFDEFIYLYEHTYNTPPSQYMATISWAASQLYQLTKDAKYAQLASEYIQYTMDCQEKTPLANGMRGYFYRDTTKISTVHYIHQSREQIYMLAFKALCDMQPDHPSFEKWAEAIALHGEYIKSLMPCTAPYGMIPSGVYMENEFEDEHGFNSLHIFGPSDSHERYTAQLHTGIKIDDNHYIRRFPIWFNIFNGNSAIILSAGKNAAICGKFMHDDVLMDIARTQLYWHAGMNPFGESLIFGAGDNYPQMDSFSSGEITGEMPVGIRSLGDDDIPFWPQVNNACYKEVWLSTAGKWLSLVSEF